MQNDLLKPTGLLGATPKKEGEVARVYRLIKGWILQGKARPGEFLGEVELARLCKTSRTPIREACNRLAQEDWLSHQRHKGYMVPPVSVREIVDVYEFRKLLECFTAEKAAVTAREDQLAALKEALALERRSGVRPEGLVAANHQVHLGLAEISGNRRVLDQLRRTLEYVDRLDLLSLERDTHVVFHDEIVRAIEAKKPRAAREAMASHIDSARNRMLKVFGG
jgi:DNA-binding GntR family transcriptional regulator